MAPNYYIFRYPLTLIPFFFFVVAVLPVLASNPSFGYRKFDKASNFDSEIALYGDSKVGGNGSFVQITGSWNFSSGSVIYRKPIKLLSVEEENGNLRRRKEASFGTYFAFSLSPEDGDGLAFVMLSNSKTGLSSAVTLFGLSNNDDLPLLAVEFDTKLDTQFLDLNDNHVGIDLGSLVSAKVANVSDLKLVLKSGEKLQCWIDYEASSKRIEVRVTKLGETRPVNPFISRQIDLSKMFNDKPVYLGLTSSNSNSTQICNLYSWSFRLREVPYWMHSEPLDPQVFTKDAQPVVIMQKRSEHCVIRVLTALIFGTGCGALGAFLALFVWSTFFTKRPVAPEGEFAVHPVEYDFDKVKVLVVDKPVKDVDNGK